MSSTTQRPVPRLAHWYYQAQHVQEQLSYAYVHAVAYMAGMKCQRQGDDFKVDAKLSYMTSIGHRVVEPGTDIHLQLKSTYRAERTETEVIYDLDADAYRFLIQDVDARRFLVLFVMPEPIPSWITMSESFLVIRHCAYWLDLRGHPWSDNEESKRVRVPRSQVFDEKALLGEIRNRAKRVAT